MELTLDQKLKEVTPTALIQQEIWVCLVGWSLKAVTTELEEEEEVIEMAIAEEAKEAEEAREAEALGSKTKWVDPVRTLVDKEGEEEKDSVPGVHLEKKDQLQVGVSLIASTG